MENFWKDFPEVTGDLERVKALLKRHLEQAPEPLRRDLSVLFKQEGKGLRPALVLLAARSGSASVSVDELAASAELLHLASLIHDDVIDNSPLRRGLPSFQAQVGLPKAVLYADLLFAFCFQLVTRGVSRESALAISKIVALMSGAEIIQLNDRFVPQSSLRRSLRKTMGKTAAFLSLCLYSGAYESGQDAATCRIYRRFGYCLGMAFQILDDILDFVSDEATLGKPILEDLRQGIYTLPVVLALRQEAETGIKTPLWNLLGRFKDDSGLQNEIAGWIKAYRGLEQSRQLAELYSRRALEELKKLPLDAPRKILAEVTQRLLNRNF
jgi:heptaprenyl diphosphate synthase